MPQKVVWYISKYANIKEFGSDTRQASFCHEFSGKGVDVKLLTSNSSHLCKKLPKFKTRYLSSYNGSFETVWVNTLQYTKTTGIKRLCSWLWFELFVILYAIKKDVKKPDIVIGSSLSLFSVFSASFCKFFYKSKFIFEVRDIWPQSIVDLKGTSSSHPLIYILSLIERWGYKYSDEIVGTMPGLSDHVSKVIGKSHKVHFIPQGVNLDFYKFEQKTVSEAFFEKYIPKNKFLVTYAGTLGIANTLEPILDAATLVLAKNSNIHFLFVGEGREKKHLEKMALDLSNVTFAPAVHKTEVQSILNRSDILIASVKNESIYKYGISLNKFIDYMYAKKAIVCMFSGFPSMVNEASCGEFTPSENAEKFATAILKYSNYPTSKLEEIGSNGHNFLVEKRSFSILAEQYMELFND